MALKYNPKSIEDLGKLYEQVIGYDIHKDDPTLTAADILQMMAEYDAETGTNEFSNHLKTLNPNTAMNTHYTPGPVEVITWKNVETGALTNETRTQIGPRIWVSEDGNHYTFGLLGWFYIHPNQLRQYKKF